ncbi:hypothetical protein Dimus_026658 [Dionaea muscipula]
MSTSAVFSRLSTLRSKNKSISSSLTHLFKSSCSQSQASATISRVSRISRLPVELSCFLTMMPLHSAIASARLCSDLSMDSQSWCLIPQGISMPL